MYPDYIVAEIAKLSANISTLNSVETILIYTMLLLGVLVVVSIFLYAVGSIDWSTPVAYAIMSIIGIALFYVLIWGLECACVNQYDALVAAYEGLI